MNTDQLRVKELQIIANLHDMGALGRWNAIPYSYVFVGVEADIAKTIARHWEIDRLVNAIVRDPATGFPSNNTTQVDISQHYYYLRANAGNEVARIIEFIKQHENEEISTARKHKLLNFICARFNFNSSFR